MANVLTRLSRGTGPFEILPSAARVADPDTQEFDALLANFAGLYVIVDVTTAVTLEELQVAIQGVDRVSGKTWEILQSAVINAVGTTVLQVGPGITATANADEDDFVPPIFRIVATHSATSSWTYSIGGILCP